MFFFSFHFSFHHLFCYIPYRSRVEFHQQLPKVSCSKLDLYHFYCLGLSLVYFNSKMAPRKQQHSAQALSNPDANCFHNTKVERFFLQMSEHSFIQKRGFDPTMFTSNEIWDLVRSNHWDTFCATLTELIVDAIVYKFYTSLKDRENRKKRGETIAHVTVLGIGADDPQKIET